MNRLAKETSPYLLQHATNPVDWYPWSKEALDISKANDKPILLSIGYSACHWCHVMERESFQDDETAKMMNDNFVNIKVDREERPDIDNIYMKALQVMSGGGGWPMTIMLTPDLKPFFGGTYFPPQDMMGLHSFKKVLSHVTQQYKENRKQIENSAEQICKRLVQESSTIDDKPLVNVSIEESFLQLESRFDKVHGGFGTSPKFPQSYVIELLFRISQKPNLNYALSMASLTLNKMAKGGIYDHLAGGFHRYTVDSNWITPHFEKMLYDNALLSSTYLHGYQLTGNKLYKETVEGVLEFVISSMCDPEGGFHSAINADSEGIEGKFYLWSRDEICGVLDGDEYGVFCKYFNVTKDGNHEGRNILNIQGEHVNIASNLDMSGGRLSEIIQSSKIKLYAERKKRISPSLDDKVIVSWNGMMLSALSEASVVFGRNDFLNIAKNNAEFIINKMYKNGLLMHVWKNDDAKIRGYLEDYAFFADGLLKLYHATFNPRWIEFAKVFGNYIVDNFQDDRLGYFYDTTLDHENPIVRPTSLYDGGVPSPGAVATRVLLALYSYTSDSKFLISAEKALKSVRMQMKDHPYATASWLVALDDYLSGCKQVVIVGDRSDSKTSEMLSAVFRSYRSNLVVAHQSSEEYSEIIPILNDKQQIDGLTTAYVCSDFVCKLPVTDVGMLDKLLN